MISLRSHKVNSKILLVDLIIYYTLFVGFFLYNFNLPSSLLYFTDFLNLILLLLCVRKISGILFTKNLKVYSICILFVVLVGILSALVYGIKVGLVIWSFRNWGRAICFFLCCCCIINENHIEKMNRFIKKLLHLNLFVILFQFVFLSSRYYADSLNGLFGRDTSSVNITFIMIVFSIVVSEYFTKNLELKKLLVYLVEINIIAVVSELKAVLFFEVFFLIVYALVNSKANLKKLAKYSLIVVVSLVGLSISASSLSRLYPEFRKYLSVSGLLKAISNEEGYGFVGYIDRLNFISVISERIFNGDWWKILFGIGIGNGEYSSVDSFTSNFYSIYGNAFRYHNFSSSAVFLEVGLIGLVLFSVAHIFLLTKCIYFTRNADGRISLYYGNIGLGISLIIIVFLFYNNIARTDISFLLSYFMAIPFVLKTEKYYKSSSK